MQVTPASMTALYQTYSFVFNQTFAGAQTTYQQLVTRVPSSTLANYYPFSDELPQAREWIGERVLQNRAARTYVLQNRDWELTVKLNRNQVEDETFGFFGTNTVPFMARQAAKQPDYMLQDLIQNGDSSSSTIYQAYDGQPFFSTAHPVNMDNSTFGTYSNRRTSTALNATNLDLMMTAVAGFKGANNKIVGAGATHLLVPPALATTARTILNAGIIAPTTGIGGNANSIAVTNVMQNAVQLIVMPELAGEDTTWYLLDLGQFMRPFIYQERKAPQFQVKDRPDDENVFWTKEFIYGWDSRGAMGYSFPFLALQAIA